MGDARVGRLLTGPGDRSSLRADRPPSEPGVPSRRFLFYTNECVGLGHLRRALILARAVTELDDGASSLVVTGAPIEPDLRLPQRVDTVKLPVLSREQEGRHRSQLAIGLADVRKLRSTLALTAAQAYRPAVAVVDKVPLGLGGELVPALESLRVASCRLVLGLRDIEDDALSVRRRWNARVRRAIRRYYDTILVYGPSATPDALASLGWDDLDVPVHHVGYVGPEMPVAAPADVPPGYLLVTVGGGADGFGVLSSFLRAVRRAPLARTTVLVTGPLMAAAEVQAIRELAAGLDVRVFEFRPDMEAVIAGARAVVAMAGYNTVSELLRARRPALLIPRVRPSQEQLIRAQTLADAGRVRFLHPDELTPESLRAALDRLLADSEPARGLPEDDGAARASVLLTRLAATTAGARR